MNERAIPRRDFLAMASLPLGALADPRAYGPAVPPRVARLPVRVGIVGAGANVQAVQLPNLRRIPECEVLAVANQTLASSEAVARQFDIPRAYASWDQLLDDADVDAVLIGTWPYMHRTVTLAALERGKHVLCQARMANDAAEAREMLEASRRHPNLVCQLVPTSTSYAIDNVLKRMIDEGQVGEVLSVEIQRLQRSFADFGGELDWRRNREFSGLNTLNLGSTYESTMRWLGRGNAVIARSKVHVPYRRTSSGELASVSIPDHVDVLFDLANGAQVHMRFSETTGLSDGNRAWIFGTEGTIFVDGEQNIFHGRRGDSILSPVPNLPEDHAVYRVEVEFIRAIQDLEEVTMLPFESGVHYMEWTEAVHRSTQTGQVVYLPLSQ
jgi:predicted dehydrogenase